MTTMTGTAIPSERLAMQQIRAGVHVKDISDATALMIREVVKIAVDAGFIVGADGIPRSKLQVHSPALDTRPRPAPPTPVAVLQEAAIEKRSAVDLYNAGQTLYQTAKTLEMRESDVREQLIAAGALRSRGQQSKPKENPASALPTVTEPEPDDDATPPLSVYDSKASQEHASAEGEEARWRLSTIGTSISLSNDPTAGQIDAGDMRIAYFGLLMDLAAKNPSAPLLDRIERMITETAYSGLALPITTQGAATWQTLVDQMRAMSGAVGLAADELTDAAERMYGVKIDPEWPNRTP